MAVSRALPISVATIRARRSPGLWTDEQIADLVFYGALGAVVGGRIGSALFYNFDKLSSDPLWVLRVWEGGMSFHGGFLGVVVKQLQHLPGIHHAVKLDELCHKPGPAGLMAGTEPRAVVTMEVFVEKEVVAPVEIGLKFLRAAVNRPAAVPVDQKDPAEAVRDFLGDFEKVHHFPRPGGTLDFEVVSIV